MQHVCFLEWWCCVKASRHVLLLCGYTGENNSAWNSARERQEIIGVNDCMAPVVAKPEGPFTPVTGLMWEEGPGVGLLCRQLSPSLTAADSEVSARTNHTVTRARTRTTHRKSCFFFRKSLGADHYCGSPLQSLGIGHSGCDGYKPINPWEKTFCRSQGSIVGVLNDCCGVFLFFLSSWFQKLISNIWVKVPTWPGTTRTTTLLDTKLWRWLVSSSFGCRLLYWNVYILIHPCLYCLKWLLTWVNC